MGPQGATHPALGSPPRPICPFHHRQGGAHSPNPTRGIKSPTKEELQPPSHLPLPSLLPPKGHFIACSCGRSATTCCAQRQMRPAHLICIKPVSWLHISRYIPNGSTNSQIFSSPPLTQELLKSAFLSRIRLFGSASASSLCFPPAPSKGQRSGCSLMAAKSPPFLQQCLLAGLPSIPFRHKVQMKQLFTPRS